MFSKEMYALQFFDSGLLRIDLEGGVFRKSKKGWTYAVFTSTQGYNLFKTPKINGKCFDVRCHRMMVVFHTRQPIPEGMMVLHLDESRNNNCLSNLKIGTAKENLNFPGFIIKMRALGKKGKTLPSRKGCHISDAQKKALSKAHKGKIVSAETRAKMSASRSGENNPNFGKHFTAEHKQNIRKSVLAWIKKNKEI
jgi:hypothetical protein